MCYRCIIIINNLVSDCSVHALFSTIYDFVSQKILNRLLIEKANKQVLVWDQRKPEMSVVQKSYQLTQDDPLLSQIINLLNTKNTYLKLKLLHTMTNQFIHLVHLCRVVFRVYIYNFHDDVHIKTNTAYNYATLNQEVIFIHLLVTILFLYATEGCLYTLVFIAKFQI